MSDRENCIYQLSCLFATCPARESFVINHPHQSAHRPKALRAAVVIIHQADEITRLDFDIYKRLKI